MDRGRAFLKPTGLSIAAFKRAALGLVVIASACAAAPEADAPINRDSLRVLRWFAPDADLVTALTTRPGSCMSGTPVGEVLEPAPVPKVEIGRLAFESPALLGGAAGRMGLSCSACHLNGRGNPDFFVEGVSGAPGTADVTNSLFSKVRGNGTFDPKPIPDVAARDGRQIKDRKGAEFRAKVHGLIAEEFDGQEPSPFMLDAVIAYMDALNVNCPQAQTRETLTADMDLRPARTAFSVATEMTEPDRHLMARAARERLERLYERFSGAHLSEAADALVAASRAVETWMEAPDRAKQDAALVAMERAGELVKRDASRSLYNPDVLRAALAR